MDLLIEKGDKRTYLSRYKVITTSFEESSPSVKRNNTQIQYRNGNVDFGGWNEAKTIDYVGYYRANDIDEEEALREKIYALLSDPDGYYVTQLKNDSDNSYERPGENTGDYFEKQVNRPSHKRFYVYASSLESELVGSYGGHVLYKISATFTTMKLPYGESVPRDLEINPNVPYISENLLIGTSSELIVDDSSNASQGFKYATVYNSLIAGSVYTFSSDVSVLGTATSIDVKPYNPDTGYTINDHYTTFPIVDGKISGLVKPKDGYTQLIVYAGNAGNTHGNKVTFNHMKFEKGNVATPWSPSPSDLEYNAWYTKIYYNTDKLIIPYAGTVPCNQLEQGFTIEFTAKEGGSGLKVNLNGTELTYSGQVYSGDVVKLSGYEYTKNDISIVELTNKDYFKLIPGITNEISSNLHGSIKILGFQDLYA